jgi:hypothetical protein
MEGDDFMRTFREISRDLAYTLESGASEMKRDIAGKGIYEPVKLCYLRFDSFIRKPAYLSKKITDLISISEDLAECCICAMVAEVRKDVPYLTVASELADFFDENIDYGKSFIENFPGDNPPKIKNKFLQFERLMKKENPNPQFVEYTLRDLASFCIMIVIAMEGSLERNQILIEKNK